MTIKEIAKMCGVNRTTVLRWAHKIADDPVQNAQGLAVKLEDAEKGGKDPAGFTLEETLAIIGEGGGNKALASLLAENARNKDALIRGRHAARYYAEHVGSASYAASKVYKLMVKYQNTDKISKQDAVKLFEYAAALCRYFNQVVTVTNMIVIHSTAQDQRLLRTCHKLGIGAEDVPAYKSWDKNEWPDFPELSASAPELLLTDGKA
jgi:AcrR family transcriptional regulator